MKHKEDIYNKTVLLRDRKRRTVRPRPHLQKFPKCLSIFCPKFCPTFCSNFFFGGGGRLPPGAPPPVGGYPRGRPPSPSWGGPRGCPPCEQTNWKHYLPVILRMRAVNITLTKTCSKDFLVLCSVRNYCCKRPWIILRLLPGWQEEHIPGWRLQCKVDGRFWQGKEYADRNNGKNTRWEPTDYVWLIT